jgi:hypothetical protein
MNAKKWERDLKMQEAEKLAKTAFVTVCSDCGDILGIRHDVGKCGLSHGYCSKCADSIRKELGERGAHSPRTRKEAT